MPMRAKGDTKSEFAIYDRFLEELAAKHRTSRWAAEGAPDSRQQLHTPPAATQTRMGAPVSAGDAAEADEGGVMRQQKLRTREQLHTIVPASRFR